MKLLRSLLTFLLCLSFICWAPANAQTYPGNLPANGTSVTAAIPSGNSVITLTADSHTVIVKAATGSSGVYLNPFGTTCTTGNFFIEPGGSFTYIGLPIRQFSVDGSLLTMEHRPA